MWQCVTQLTVFPLRRSLADTDETTIKTVVMPAQKNSMIAFRYFAFLKMFHLRMTPSSRIDYPSIERDCHDLPRDELAARLQRLLLGPFKTAAARNLHADDGHGLDVVLADDLSLLLIGVHQ